jgi:RNA recognition motif-containing protein
METIRFFSTPLKSDLFQQKPTVQPPVNATDQKSKSRKNNAALKRHRAMIRRKTAKLSEQHGIQLLRPTVPELDEEYFSDLFQKSAPAQNFSNIDEALQEIELRVKKYKNDSTSKSRGVVTSRELPLSSILLKLLHQTHPQKTLQILILEKILAAKRPISKKARKAIKQLLPTKKEKRQLLNTLLAAREFVIKKNIPWDGLMAEKEESTNGLFNQIKNEKMVQKEEQEKDAKLLVQHLSKSLPSKSFRALAKMLKSYTGDASSRKSKVKHSEKQQLPSNHLSYPVENCVGDTHYHLISKQVKKFFYFNLCTINQDSKYKNSKMIWDRMKEKFVESMIKLQKELHDNDNKGAASNAECDVEVDDFQQRVGLSKIQRRVHRPKLKVHVIFDAMPLLEFRSMEPNCTPSQPVNGTYTNGIFDGASLNGDHGPVNGEKNLQNSAVKHIVFIDNLPVDITEPELRELYDRLGEIKQLEIFNLRPDLDPGKLTQTESKKIQKKQEKSISITKRWQRRKTPVYAIIEFANEEGQRKALDDSLRIFGMIIRRHPSRSIRPSDMMSLFIEQIPSGLRCVELEHQLSQALSPNYFVSLQAGQRSTAMAGSCEIKFPSFESAYESYTKLKELEIFSLESACRINWVPTQSDAEDWYTKKLGF